MGRAICKETHQRPPTKLAVTQNITTDFYSMLILKLIFIFCAYSYL